MLRGNQWKHPSLWELAISVQRTGTQSGDMRQERGDTNRLSVGRINSDLDAANEIFHGILLLRAVRAPPITEPHWTFVP